MSCKDPTVFEAPFNFESSVQAYAGLLFDIRARDKEISVETFELDIKSAQANNLNVDIWTTDEAITSSHSEAAKWQSVAKTALVKNPDGEKGAIVPAFHFENVKISPQQTKAFYIRMAGPYLDNTLSSTVSAGQDGAVGAELVVLAGYPVSQQSLLFPATLDTSAAPIFSGKIHYKATKSCDALSLTTTTVQYALLLNQNLQLDDFNNLKAATSDVMDSVLANDEVLNSFVTQDGLKQKVDGISTQWRSFSGECPASWSLSSCKALLTSVQFEHSKDRSSGDIQERLYTYYLDVSQEQLKVLADGAEAAYAGLVDAQAKFDMTLEGVSRTDEMGEEQMAYLADQVVAFANDKLLQDRAQVFNFNVDEQELFDYDSIALKGTISGAIIAVETNSDFAKRFRNIFRDSGDDFLAALKFNLNYPGPIATADRHTFFVDASGVTMDALAADVTRAPTPSPTRGEDVIQSGLDAAKENFGDYVAFIAAGLGVLVLICILFCCFNHRKKQKRLEEERELRKEERKQRSLLRKSEDDDSTMPPSQIAFNQHLGNDDDPYRKARGFGEDYDPSSASDRFMDEHSQRSNGFEPSGLHSSEAHRYSLSSNFRSNLPTAPAPETAPTSPSQDRRKSTGGMADLESAAVNFDNSFSAADLEDPPESARKIPTGSASNLHSSEHSKKKKKKSRSKSMTAAESSSPQSSPTSSRKKYSKSSSRRGSSSSGLDGKSGHSQGRRGSSSGHSMSRRGSSGGLDGKSGHSKSKSKRRKSHSGHGHDDFPTGKNLHDEDPPEDVSL